MEQPLVSKALGDMALLMEAMYRCAPTQICLQTNVLQHDCLTCSANCASVRLTPFKHILSSRHRHQQAFARLWEWFMSCTLQLDVRRPMDLQLDDCKVRALLPLAHEYDMPGLMGALTAYLLLKSCQVQPAAPGLPVPPLAEMWITANTAKVPLATSCAAPAIPPALRMLNEATMLNKDICFLPGV